MALKPGFDFHEVKVLIGMAQAVYDAPSGPTGHPLEVQPPDPTDLGWTCRRDLSPAKGCSTLLDNYWEVWQNEKNETQYAIAVRGTVNTDMSRLADLLLPLVNARFDILLDIDGLPVTLPFHLARDEGDSAVKAGVHAGMALSLVLMLLTTDRPLFKTLVELAEPGNDVYITGHSQGASIATLLTSLVNHSTDWFKGPRYKSYVFAPGKPGNDHYAYDYADLVGFGGYGWSVVSTQGWVPQAGLTLQATWDLNTPNPFTEFGGAPNPIRQLPGLAGAVTLIDDGVGVVRDAAVGELKWLVGDVAAKLVDDLIALEAAIFGAASDAPLTGSQVGAAIRQFLDQVQASQNYTYAGSLVPLFAKPGGNPDDPADFFWQHYLGHYWTYLQYRFAT